MVPAINKVQVQCKGGVGVVGVNSALPFGTAVSPPKHFSFQTPQYRLALFSSELPSAMNVDSSRVWPVPNHPPLNHDTQNQNQSFPHTHPDPNLVYPPPQDHQPTQNFNMNRQQPYDLSNAPLSYPPPPPPTVASATRSHTDSAYGQAPQGAPYPPPPASASATVPPASSRRRDGRASPKPESYYAPNAAELYNHAQMISHSPSPGPEGSGSSQGGGNRDQYPSSVPRLPPILQVEKQQVTTSATQAASASRRRNEAHFVCPVPGCGSTFTRRFNLRGPSKILADTTFS